MTKLKDLIEGLNLGTLDGHVGENISKPTGQRGLSQVSAAPPTEVAMSSEQKKKLHEMVSKYNEYGKHIYRDAKISEVAKNMSELTDLAEGYILQESGDWFEETTIKRNMAELRKYNESFNKIASDMQIRQHQLEALYEDCGKILQRYFEIAD